MSKCPSLLSGCNGKPQPHEIGRATVCCHCKVALVLGTRCVIIPKTGGSYKAKKIFCLACLMKVLLQTKKDLAEVEKLLADPAVEVIPL